jgi:hypothetical protein
MQMNYATMILTVVGIVFVGLAAQFLVTGRSQAAGIANVRPANRREKPRGFWLNVAGHLGVGLIALGAAALTWMGRWPG